VAQGKIDWEDLTGQLVFSVNQLGKAPFLRDLSRNTTRGQVASARVGKSGTGGRAPYGYRQDGSEVWIVPEEAEVVRWIFAEYLKPGSGLRAIADDLNRRGIAPPGGSSSKGGKWRNSTVRAILKRRKYTGSFVYGRRTVGRYFGIQGGEIIPRRKTDGVEWKDPISGWSFGSGSGSGSSHSNNTGQTVLPNNPVFVQGTCTPKFTPMSEILAACRRVV
jgi:hypothetical protein